MDEPDSEQNLFQLWMIYTSKTDPKALQKYIEQFIKAHSNLLDYDFTHLNEGFSEEGPNLTKLPDGTLQMLANELNRCCLGNDLDMMIHEAISLLNCLIIICRNLDNVPQVASYEFTTHAVNLAANAVELIGKISEDIGSQHMNFLRIILHFFECLYDPFFIWRKRLLGWTVEQYRQKYKPASLHVEIIPFFYDCFQHKLLPSELKVWLIHMFGAVISGCQHNALNAITPATLDVLLNALSTGKGDKPTNEQRQELLILKTLVLKCMIQMVHVIHGCSPDQRQVEVSQIIEGYLHVLHDTDIKLHEGENTQMQLSMIDAINEMLLCNDKSAMQAILVSGGTFNAFMSLLQKTSLSGSEAQTLAMSVIKVICTMLAGSTNAKEQFNLRVGYGKFVEVLKSLGQPSIDLLKAVLNLVVEAEYEEKKSHIVHNINAAIMLIQWLPDIQSHDLQIWLAEHLRLLCSLDHSNKMCCCNNGMIGAILIVLEREKQIDSAAVSHLIGLLESLGTQSITAMELKQMIGLLRLDADGNQCLESTCCNGLVRAMSTMARREGKEGVLHFFSIQEQTDGILLPGIRKWPGTAFAIHIWVCLNKKGHISPSDHHSSLSYRYTLYSFLSNSGFGFEAHVTQGGELTVAVFSKKEYNAVTAPHTDLLDSRWHAICIVHTSSKRPFGTSQLYMYVDGVLKLNSQLKYPNMSETLTSCRVGSPVFNPQNDLLDMNNIHYQETKRISPFRSFLKSAASRKSVGNLSSIDSLPAGSQDERYGLPIPLNGQIGSVCILHEAVTAHQVKLLYTAGPNSLTVFTNENELSDLPGKMVLYYNAKACENTNIMDLSGNQNHGRLFGQKCTTWDIKDVINCIGGIQVLFPLLEQVNKLPDAAEATSPSQKFMGRCNKSKECDGWVIIRSSSYTDRKLEQNQVAGFLTLIRNMIQTSAVNQQTFVQTNAAAVISALLQKVKCKLIDVNVLMAVQLLREATAYTNKVILHHLYQYILFDFRIWSRSDFPVRIGHIQYLSTIIKDDRRHFRKLFDVQYLLDVIRSHYSAECGLSEEDAKTVRMSLLNLVKYYIAKDVTFVELSALLNFMIACHDEHMICESLDVIMSLLDSSRRHDQLYLLMFEPEVGEMLYGLLLVQGYTIVYYEKIVKVLYILLKTDKVYEKNKSRMRLQDCGYLGLIDLIKGFEVSGPTIKRFLEQVSIPDTPQGYNAVLAVLQLIYNSGFDIKLEASRQLLAILATKTGAAKNFAKQLGWQEAITKLFILYPIAKSPCIEIETNAITIGSHGDNGKASNVKAKCSETGDSEQMHLLQSGHTEESINMLPGNQYVCNNSETPNACNLKNCDNKLNDAKCDNVDDVLNSQQPQELICDRNNSTKQFTLDLISLNIDQDRNSNVNNAVDSFANVDSNSNTPLYLKSHVFDDSNMSVPEDEEENRAVSRSASTSMEDLSMVAESAAENQSLQRDTSSSSLSLMTNSDSNLDLSGDNPELRRPSFTSRVNYRIHMMDSLGLRGSFLMDQIDDSDELCYNLLVVLFTIMWQGVEGSDEMAWKERGQVFSWFDNLNTNNDLICTPDELKRRLLEMMLHACTTEIRDKGLFSQSNMENALELVRLVRYFITANQPINNDNLLTEQLLEDVLNLLDSLAVWDVQSGAGWQEMAYLGLCIIVAFAQHTKLEVCSRATVRLHQLIQTKLISSSAEAAYLIGHLNNVIIQAINDQTSNYSYLIPVMKALIDKAYQLLNLDINLPNLPSTSTCPTFFEDFKIYCKSEEWTKFISYYVEPQKQHFTENNFDESSMKVAMFWANCQEEIMRNMHRRYREKGESKIKFQNLVLNVFNKKVTLEEKRFHNVSTQLRNQHNAALRKWRAAKRFFTGERGAWAERQNGEIHWKLSNQENFLRMKVKMIQNYNFNIHREASLLRDNLGADSSSAGDDIKLLSVTKAAVVSKENIGDDGLGDEDWNVINSQNSSAEEYQDKEKLVLTEECELVTLVEVVTGRLEVTTTHVYFFDCSSQKEDGGEDFKWALSQLREIHFRRYNLRRSAIELFLIDQTNYFLNFRKQVRNRVYSRILSLRPPNLIYYGSRSPAELLKASGLTQKWMNWEISNFEYLMQLNTIAGRTYNDLSQYPVFPWILVDYTSESINLEDPSVFRDLSKPMGVLNPRNVPDVRDKFDNFEDPAGVIEKFHYGTHYSNAATVMHYMIRMEPFTTLHIALQSGRFDVADRQFHSIPGTWKSMYNNPNDVKELIPEFFYLSEFLVNTNKFDLGKLQITHEQVHDVILPTWAKSPDDFIYQHRKALESNYVSHHLHNWIDLIFGYKQKGPAAIDALNVFYYCTYEGAVDLDAIKDPKERTALEGMINNFGQTPSQLMKEPHPRRLTFDEVVNKSLKIDRHLSIFNFLDVLKIYFVEVSAETDPLVYVVVPRSQPRSIIHHGMLDTMVTVSLEGIIGAHGWLPYDKSISNYFTFEKDLTVSNLKTRKKFSSPFAPGLKVDAKLFVVTHDAKLLISGGHWDNSLQVYNIAKGRKTGHICRHIDVVTCVALDYCGSQLITGSRDTTCIIWQVQQLGGVCVNVSPKPLQTLYGHDDEVTAVYISSELDMAVSASNDGSVMIHTVRRGHYMRTLRPPTVPGYTHSIRMIAVDDMGRIVVCSHEVLPLNRKEHFHTLHLYSLNGKHLCSKRIEHHLSNMVIKGDHLITGDKEGYIIVYEIFGLKQLTTLPLFFPIQSLSVSNGNSHIFAGLKDGKLIIVGIKLQEQ